MTEPAITNVPQLQTALQAAVALEFSTIPPYLCGWWTITDPSMEAATLIQSIVIVEMRHMAVAANTLIATGGTPNVTAAVQNYPTYLPDGEDEFEVNLLPFGEAFLNQAMEIEQPTPDDQLPEGAPPPRQHALLAMGDIYPTIAQFYDAIMTGITTLVTQLGEAAVFPNGGNVDRQLTYFGPQKITVNGSAAAIALLTDIVEEGEGASGGMWDENNQLSHYYTFQEISLGRTYQPGDQPLSPSGPPIPIPTGSQVANMVQNPTMAMYDPNSQTWTDANAFNELFAQIVGNLELGFNGEPDQVQTAIGQMLQLPAAAARVLADPVAGQPGYVAGPTFQLPPYPS
jgi:hypothetical protein